MREEEEENKSGLAHYFSGRSSGRQAVSSSKAKRYWWLPFACVFLFLLAGGYYAVTAMRQSAHKLVGGDSYNQLSANSVIYNGKSAVPKDDNFFPSEEQPSAGAQGNSGGDRLRVSGSLAGKNSGVSSEETPAGTEVPGGGNNEGQSGPGSRGWQSAQAQASLSLPARLRARVFSAGRSSGLTKSSGEARVVAFQENAGVTGVAAAQGKPQQAAASGKGGGAGVLDSLRGAFRASVYGARITSQDSAKGWIARSFDATPEAATAIKYDEKTKSELDTVNPNSIPNFLRDQDLSAAGAKTLSASAVSKPGLDTDAAKKDPTNGLLPGMMNGIFKGLMTPKTDSVTSPTTDPATDPPSDDYSGQPTTRGPTDDSKSKKDLGTTDEYGYTSYGPSTGFQTVFNKDGKQVGCTDNAAGISYMYGSPGCP